MSSWVCPDCRHLVIPTERNVDKPITLTRTAFVLWLMLSALLGGAAGCALTLYLLGWRFADAAMVGFLAAGMRG